jgi:SAM-dependent methyltransferase
LPYFDAQYGKFRRLFEPFIITNPRIDKVLGALPSHARICDVGAGGRRVTPGTITVDAFWGKNTDIVSDAAALAIADETMDCVVCTGTFEHLPDPWKAAREIARIAKPGGVVYVDAPFMQGYHADPNDYWRFTQDGLRRLFDGFEEIDAGVHIGPASGLSWVFVAFCQGLAGGEFSRKIMFRLGRLVAFPWKYLDLFAVRKPYSYLAASGVYYVGRKPVERRAER